MSEREELEKKAQEKLSEAWRLIREAGDLAKQGQFYLNFGEVGEFIPSSFDNRENLREQALAELKRDGRNNDGKWVKSLTEKYPDGSPKSDWIPNPTTPFDELTEEEVEEELEAIIDGIIDASGASSEGREYGARDTWWAPSRC